MKKKPVVVAATGMVGLMASGLTISLLAWPSDAGNQQLAMKREEDTPDIVLVADDDEDDATDDVRARASADTNTRASNTRSRISRDTRRDRSRTGARSGRDDSRSGRKVRDWTTDGPGLKKRDWSANRTNDRSRNNTRR